MLTVNEKPPPSQVDERRHQSCHQSCHSRKTATIKFVSHRWPFGARYQQLQPGLVLPSRCPPAKDRTPYTLQCTRWSCKCLSTSGCHHSQCRAVGERNIMVMRAQTQRLININLESQRAALNRELLGVADINPINLQRMQPTDRGVGCDREQCRGLEHVVGLPPLHSDRSNKHVDHERDVRQWWIDRSWGMHTTARAARHRRRSQHASLIRCNNFARNCTAQ